MVAVVAAPPLRPSLLVRAGWALWRDRYGWQDRAAHVIVGALALLYFGQTVAAMLLLPVSLLALGVAGLRVWQVRTGRRAPVGRFGRVGRLLALTYVTGYVTVLLAVLGWPLLALLAPLGLLEVLTRTDEPETEQVWWAHERMARALVAAKVLTSPGRTDDGADRLPTLRYRGRPNPTDLGVTVTYDLPEGATWENVVKRHAELASAMRLPVERLHIEHDDDHPACSVSVTVLDAQQKGMRPATLPDRAVWADGVPIGPDRLGKPVTVPTVGGHAVIVAATGAGKTCLARYVVSHALLDPTVRLFCIDGKDDLDDWRPMAPLCERYVGGVKRPALRDVEDVLATLDRISDERGNAGRGAAPIVVVIDEAYRIRQAAQRHDPNLAKRLDSLLAELAATGRSRNISILLLAQRGTVEYVPTDLRANMTRRIVGKTYEASEVRYVLDQTPEVLPSQVGQFLFGSDRTTSQLALAPRFDDADFLAVVKRAAAVREEMPLPPLTSGAVMDPLEAAVTLLLADGPQLASHLFAALPDGLRPTSEMVLGKRLAKMPSLTRAKVGNARGWAVANCPLPARSESEQSEQIRPFSRSDGQPDGLPTLPTPSAVEAS